ncbi:nuclease-related domain-containing protein [Streptomyces sp. JV185]|uniref:nuclease-related domain-containing protein n=1 Tax=Streptomyces sp. JV185 TaxID=858638 RepID=UPI002E7950DD|nr:nuclease-related domain-containing protein [Streptomyces sp. JV185]MEE1774465.1 nuclease-related domain-containing protein [Streptomyces sp. JV185]
MTTLIVLAVIAAWLYQHRTKNSTPGAGASAEARARQLRTPAVRIADALNIPTQRGREADRNEAGAEGERRTAAQINPLRREGWTILHDLALPTGKANVDHLAISPTGVVIMPDTKRWSARFQIRTSGGRLFHGDLDATNRLNGVRHETRTIAKALGVPVIPLIVMDGAPIEGGELAFDGIRIVPAERAPETLRQLGRAQTGRDARALAARATHLFPPHTRKHQ